MKLNDALNVLNLKPGCTQEEIKTAYKIQAMTYHPDRNPNGLSMMKIINNAMDSLRDYEGQEVPDFSAQPYASDLDAAIKAINIFDLEIEICGAWVWVTGNTKPAKDNLKAAGFHWAPAKKAWYYRPADWKKSKSRGSFSLTDIRAKYGSQRAKEESGVCIA